MSHSMHNNRRECDPSILKPNFRHNRTSHFPNISKPKIVGSFSVDKLRKYQDGNTNLKYLVLPKDKKFSFNLNENYESYQFKPEQSHSEKIDHLLSYILKNLDKCKLRDAEHAGQFLKHDFVCFRGLLRMLMCTPYEFRESWTILATKYKGTVYLCAKELEEKRMDRLNATEMSKKILAYGFKFEQFILADEPQSIPDTTQPVIESEEFCCMFETRLEDVNVLYGAEMDGIKADELIPPESLDLNKQELIEVKVKLKEKHDRQITNYHKFKLRNWWCQSFLVGVNEVYVGLRNDDGFVDEIEQVNLKSMVHLGKNYWCPSTCLSFCIKFLKYAQFHTQQLNDPFSVVKFDWSPAERQDRIQFSIHEGPNAHSFLPNWYFSKLK